MTGWNYGPERSEAWVPPEPTESMGQPASWPAYGPGMAGGWPPAPRQVPPPYGYRAAPSPPRVALPATGIGVVIAAVVVFAGSVTPWATALGGLISASGTSGDGIITLVLGLLLLGDGLIILLGHGRLWVSIVGAVLAGLVSLIALIDLVNIDSKATQTGGLIRVGPGLWMTLVGGLLAVAACVVAMVNRRARSQ